MRNGADVEMSVDAIAALEKGSKIEAIKIIRESSGLGLKDSKEFVEHYLANNPQVNQRLKDNSRSGGAFFLVLIVMFCGIIYMLYSKHVF
ncbi:MAG: ribosomal protein L7/L12 [Pseudomonadales bacterium]|nr:ribosomal protein L7/L12 [Pseudomonadales bacterium]